MNRLSTITGLGFILIFALAVSIQGARKESVSKTQESAKQTAQPAKPVKPTVTPRSQLTPQQPTPMTTIPPSTRTATEAATYEINWESVNAGGGPSSSTNYSVNASAGQSTIGYATSANYEAGAGYWYGTGGGCSCPFQSDFDEDGFLTALDLSACIDILFAGSPDVSDPDCPSPRADFDCDSFSTALDLGMLIDHLFAGGDGPCEPCGL
jgi:hypothetical protein